MSRSLIEAQIDSLKNHPHIKKLQIINNRFFQMVYSPRDLKSHYANSDYRIKIELPIKYPQQPPSIKFIDPIQHINIGRSGQVTMPILEQDWSPYISLYILIDLIDTILVEPQLSSRYCIGSQRSLRFFKDKDKMNGIKFNDTKSFESKFKNEDDPIMLKLSGNSEISAIRKDSFERQEEEAIEEDVKPIQTMKKKLKRLKTIMLEKADIGTHNQQQKNKRQQIQEGDQPFNKILKNKRQLTNIKEEEQQDNYNSKIYSRRELLIQDRHKISHDEDIMKRQSCKSPRALPVNFKTFKEESTTLKRQKPIKRIQSKRSQVYQVVEQTDFPQLPSTRSRGKDSSPFKHLPTLKRNSTEKQVQSVINKEMNSTVFFDHTTHNLDKINRLIDVFTNELNELQKKKIQTKNEFLVRVIDRKIKQQMSMLEELQELSSTVKKKMIQNIRRQVSK